MIVIKILIISYLRLDFGHRNKIGDSNIDVVVDSIGDFTIKPVSKKKMNPKKKFLSLVGQTENGEFLRHPAFENLLGIEWSKLPTLVYHFNLLTFVVLVVFYSIYLEFYKNADHRLTNLSKYISLALTIYFLVLEIIQLLNSLIKGKILLHYLSFKNLFEIVTFPLCIAALFLNTNETKSAFLSTTILLNYAILLFRMDKFWKIGKYVGVIGNIIIRSGGLLIIVLIFFIGFLLSFRNRIVTYSDAEENTMSFYNSTFENGLFKIMLFSLGNIEVEDMGIESLSRNSLVNFIIYSIFIFIIPILVINIFTGITIDELQNLIENSVEKASLTKIYYIEKIEIAKNMKFFGFFVIKAENLVVIFRNSKNAIARFFSKRETLKKYFKMPETTIDHNEITFKSELDIKKLENKIDTILFEFSNVHLRIDKIKMRLNELKVGDLA